ncbi:hypothetical protein D3C85_1870050 [compost metagenome]
MQALELALGLRVAGTAMTDTHAQTHEPNLQARQAGAAHRGPGWAVVCRDPFG